MTIADLFASMLRPCGAAHAPPKSPLLPGPSLSEQAAEQDKAQPTSSSSQPEQQTSRPNQPSSGMVVQKDTGRSMMIDCAAIKDKAPSQQDQQGSSMDQGNQQGNEVLATENMPGSARKMVPVDVEESDEASAEIANAFG